MSYLPLDLSFLFYFYLAILSSWRPLIPPSYPRDDGPVIKHRLLCIILSDWQDVEIVPDHEAELYQFLYSDSPGVGWPRTSVGGRDYNIVRK
ncbi:hypothetical protein BDV24DRAFT_132419 [Aspergillus arachidicola]|uniref:Uncharacterized protein n=1 Tax=Aspergillus arachidicola TaxID=656916 RepID=A0A5N6Y6N9_9EURO|nr:hypothetical protein BDV24DRAFT_132419 [Aspergillus arachidicola]